MSVSFAGRSCWRLSAAVCGRVKQTERDFLSGCKSQRATVAALKTLQKDDCNRLGQLIELPCGGKQACKQFLSSCKLMQQFSTTRGSFYPWYFHQASLWKNAPHEALPNNYFYMCKPLTDLFKPDVWLKVAEWVKKKTSGQMRYEITVSSRAVTTNDNFNFAPVLLTNPALVILLQSIWSHANAHPSLGVFHPMA